MQGRRIAHGRSPTGEYAIQGECEFSSAVYIKSHKVFMEFYFREFYMAAKKLYYSYINISIIYVMKVYLSLKSKQYSLF